MFKKKQHTSCKSFSILSRSAVLSGIISTDDDLRIDGTVDGDIHCKGFVIIGSDGCVRGNYKVRTSRTKAGYTAISPHLILLFSGVRRTVRERSHLST